MDIFETISQRRSVRKYNQQPLTDEELQIILDAAMSNILKLQQKQNNFSEIAATPPSFFSYLLYRKNMTNRTLFSKALLLQLKMLFWLHGV